MYSAKHLLDKLNTEVSIFEQSPHELLCDWSECILHWNIAGRQKQLLKNVRLKYDGLVQLYLSYNSTVDEDNVNDDDVINWLISLSEDYASKHSVYFPAHVISSDDYAYNIFNYFRDIIECLCEDFHHSFEKEIGDKPFTYGISSKTETKYGELFAFLLHQEDLDCAKHKSLTRYIDFIYPEFTIADRDKLNTNPFVTWMDKTGVFNTIKGSFFDKPNVLLNTMESPDNKKAISDACKIFHFMVTCGATDNVLFDHLVKILVVFYGTFELFAENIEGAANFICGYFDFCASGKPMYCRTIDGKHVAELVFYYPLSYAINATFSKAYSAIYGSSRKKPEYSSEAAIGSGYDFGRSQMKSNAISSQNFAVNNVDERYKAKFNKVRNIWDEITKVKPGKIASKINAAYFKKWIGRIPGMYAHYANEATVTENRMKGDPTLVLANAVPAYITKIVTNTNKLFQTLIDLSRRVASASEINAKMNVVKSFCATYRIEDPRDPKEVENCIKNEAMFRIAECILQDHNVYGYSAEGIVENGKFPTANHIVTSLFIDNGHEEPEEMTVSNIFSKPESITIFAHPEKLNNFDALFKKVSNAITQNFNHKILSNVHENMELNYKNYANSLRRKSGDVEGGDADEASLNKKLAKAIENGVVSGLDLIIEQKARCLQCVGASYDMLGRVEKLAKLCVAALHAAEVKHGDTRMNTGIKGMKNVTNARLNYVNKDRASGKYVQQSAKYYY